MHHIGSRSGAPSGMQPTRLNTFEIDKVTPGQSARRVTASASFIRHESELCVCDPVVFDCLLVARDAFSKRYIPIGVFR